MGTTAEKLQAILNSKAAIKAAIEAKGVENVGDVLSTYPDAIASISTGSGWTGHADADGLKAIGWTDEDIAYYQEHVVNWNEEDDQYHLVPEDNKALYGVINIDNIQDYKDILVYLPKIDTTGVTSMANKFQNCYSLVAAPLFNTSIMTNMSYMFVNCYSLVCVPMFDTANVTNISNMFNACYSLVYVPPFETSIVKSMNGLFGYCYSLLYAPKFNTNSVTDVSYMFSGCDSLVSVQIFDMATIASINRVFSTCYSLRFCNIKNLKLSIDISATSLLEKSSLIYMIENAAPTSAITITLSAYCYNKFSNDADVLAALSAQPLVSLASA